MQTEGITDVKLSSWEMQLDSTAPAKVMLILFKLYSQNATDTKCAAMVKVIINNISYLLLYGV